MVRILRIVNSMDIGGLERGVYNLTFKLDKNKFEHVFCCLQRKGYFGEQLEKKRFKLYELRKKKGFGFNLIPKIRRIIKKEKIDIVHTHNTHPFQLGILASLGLNVLRIHTDHNSFANNESRYILLLNRFFYNFVDKVICVTESIRRDWIEKVGVNTKKLVAIYNGSDISQFDININVAKEMNQLGLNKKDKVIGIVARLAKEKDIFTLLMAFKFVNEKVKGSKLLIIGDGPLRNQLEEFAKYNKIKNVKFLGMRTDVLKLMKIFDVYALSSLSEGNSQTIREAMAASKPVVATNVGGNPELVVDGVTGFLVPKRNPERMAEAIVNLLENRKLREKMGKEGKKRVEKYFRIEKQAENYEKLYDQFLR